MLKLCLTPTTQVCLALASVAPQSWAAAEADYVLPEQFPSLQEGASEDIVQLSKPLCTSGDEQLKLTLIVSCSTAHGRENIPQSH